MGNAMASAVVEKIMEIKQNTGYFLVVGPPGNISLKRKTGATSIAARFETILACKNSPDQGGCFTVSFVAIAYHATAVHPVIIDVSFVQCTCHVSRTAL